MRAERENLQRGLQSAAGVGRVYPSRGNFVLARFDDAQAAFDRLLAAGVVVRDMRRVPGLRDALRITVGCPAQNAAVLQAVAGERVAALRMGSGQA